MGEHEQLDTDGPAGWILPPPPKPDEIETDYDRGDPRQIAEEFERFSSAAYYHDLKARFMSEAPGLYWAMVFYSRRTLEQIEADKEREERRARERAERRNSPTFLGWVLRLFQRKTDDCPNRHRGW